MSIVVVMGFDALLNMAADCHKKIHVFVGCQIPSAEQGEYRPDQQGGREIASEISIRANPCVTHGCEAITQVPCAGWNRHAFCHTVAGAD